MQDLKLVASTKAFTSSSCINSYYSFLKYKYNEKFADQNEVIDSFAQLPIHVKSILDQSEVIKKIAKKYSRSHNFYI